MNKEKQIQKLKERAKGYYLGAMDNPYDCGYSLLGNISTHNINMKTKFNEIMDQLAELDPNTPKTRL